MPVKSVSYGGGLYGSVENDPSLFDGLAIQQEADLCEEYLGQYPVVSVSLKDIEREDFDTARQEAVKIINQEA